MTILAQLDLDESSKLDFGITVSGTDNKDMNIRFIIEGPEYDIVCRCIESAGVITANVPKLNGVLPPGVYTAKLEVMVGGKYFQPLTESIQFNPGIVVGLSSGVQVKQSGVRIETQDINVRVSEDSIVVKPLSKEVVKNSSFSDYVSPSVLESNDTPKNRKIVEMYEKIKDFEDKIKKAKNTN